jgi:hypothetical protein
LLSVYFCFRFCRANEQNRARARERVLTCGDTKKGTDKTVAKEWGAGGKHTHTLNHRTVDRAAFQTQKEKERAGERESDE